MLLVLYLTNPSKADFKAYAKENYQEIVQKSETSKDGSIESAVNAFIHSLNDGAVMKIERKEYYLFSIYGMASPQLGQVNTSKYIGVFKLFIKIG